MRSIKFKVWDKKNKCWVADGLDMDLYYSAKTGYFMFDNDNYDLAQMDIEFVQFTGLLDKNGKEIYEGDIVRTPLYGQRHCEVTFMKAGFYLLLDTGIGTNLYEPSGVTMEIIGNIYQNLELMKG